jgi:hypothetical protein
MTKEDKELSFIDISGRLHYGVIVNYKESEYEHPKWKITNLHTLSYSKSGTLIDTDYDGWIGYEEYKGCGMSTGSKPFRFGEVLPYLRQMSSMTEEEKVQLSQYACIGEDLNGEFIDEVQRKDCAAYIDWLNKHHFDYRGLIEKGLALEAPEGMYN